MARPYSADETTCSACTDPPSLAKALGQDLKAQCQDPFLRALADESIRLTHGTFEIATSRQHHGTTQSSFGKP